MKPHIQIVIPMAGYATRLRPLTWSRPKPLVAMAGRTALDFLLDEFIALNDLFETEYIFIISPNGWPIQQFMKERYPHLTCHFILQEEMKGQSHAIYLTKDLLHGPMIMTFSDTLLKTELSFLKDESLDGIAWTQEHPQPQRFGVAVTDSSGRIEKLIEKPATDEHKMVIVGFYYFRDGEQLIHAIERQIKENISLKGEFYIADAINIMLRDGANFGIKEVANWLDAGVPEALLSTNAWYLDHGHDNSTAAARHDALIIPPVFIAEDAEIHASVIGPHVSISSGCKIQNAVISNSIIDKSARISNMSLKDSLIGEKAVISADPKTVFLGDNSAIM